jgi:hypothetical protein
MHVRNRRRGEGRCALSKEATIVRPWATWEAVAARSQRLQWGVVR